MAALPCSNLRRAPASSDAQSSGSMDSAPAHGSTGVSAAGVEAGASTVVRAWAGLLDGSPAVAPAIAIATSTHIAGRRRLAGAQALGCRRALTLPS